MEYQSFLNPNNKKHFCQTEYLRFFYLQKKKYIYNLIGAPIPR